MNDTTHSCLYLSLGMGGVALAAYSINLAYSLSSTSEHYLSSFTLCMIVACACAMAGLVNIYIAYAFGLGKIDKVQGTMEAASLFRAELKVREEIRIRYARVLGTDDLSLTDDERRVIFIGAWRPWVCPLSTFKLLIPD